MRAPRSSSVSGGLPLRHDLTSPWMDSVMQFVQVDATGRPEPLEAVPSDEPLALDAPWSGLRERARKLLYIR